MADENDVPSSLGDAISRKRKALGLSQRELAERIKKEDGQPITPQYLNDIERDRRTPSSDNMVEQFASALGIDQEYLRKFAGKYPSDIVKAQVGEAEFTRELRAFRQRLQFVSKKQG